MQRLQQFWHETNEEAKNATDFKTYQLPLARIKKIMKTDKDVKVLKYFRFDFYFLWFFFLVYISYSQMISQEAPVLFAKACEIFIRELTLRAWMQTEENKRKTLQRNDIAAAISKTDMFDFLIDIVPRDDIKMSNKKLEDHRHTPEMQQYIYQLHQQQLPERTMDMMYYQHLQQQQLNRYLAQQHSLGTFQHHQSEDSSDQQSDHHIPNQF